MDSSVLRSSFVRAYVEGGFIVLFWLDLLLCAPGRVEWLSRLVTSLLVPRCDSLLSLVSSGSSSSSIKVERKWKEKEEGRLSVRDRLKAQSIRPANWLITKTTDRPKRIDSTAQDVQRISLLLNSRPPRLRLRLRRKTRETSLSKGSQVAVLFIFVTSIFRPSVNVPN